MPDPITGLVVAGGSLLGSSMQAKAAGSAAETQAGAAQAGIDEQRRQFDAMRELLKPYTDVGAGGLAGMQPYAAAGAPALEQQQALLGLQGPEAERAAIERIRGGETFKALSQQGEEAMLQRASATGGLRGGNIQGALAEFRPALLSSLIEQQYGRLGGMTSIGQTATQNLATIGQASAAGVGAAGMQTGTNVANLLGQQGAAQAGGQLGQAKAYGQFLNMPAQLLGMQYGSGSTPGFGNLFSDRRLKKNIKQISTRPDGLNVYEFDYIWGGGRQIGLMAQEVQTIYPSAVSESGGYLMVDYSKV